MKMPFLFNGDLLPLKAAGLLLVFFITPQLNAGESFLKISELDAKARAKLAPAIDATFQFRLDPGISCTGAFISQSGHFLTAQHCIAGCLAKTKSLLRTRASEDPLLIRNGEKVYTDKFTVNQDKIDSGVTCQGKIAGQEMSVKVLLTGGQGWLFPKDTIALFAKKYPDDQKFLFENGYENAFDFAVLKAETLSGKPFKPKSCLKLARSAPAKMAKLQTVSFACLDREKIYTHGKQALLSQGHRTLGISESRYFKKAKSREPAFDLSLVDRKETFFSSLDMEKCGSGSPILDKQLQIVGVATRVYKNTRDYEFGSLESVDIAQLWRDLLKKKSGSDIKEITDCRSLTGF